MSWDLYEKKVGLDLLNGKTIDRIAGLEKGSDEVRVFTTDGCEFLFYHSQNCCESVLLEDFEADATDWTGALITEAVVVTNSESEPPQRYSEYWTWTFYKIETSKGGLWMRWLGESNGYYSESVDFAWVNKPEAEQ